MARDAAVWFVMIGGQQAGPMSRAEVGLEFATGAIDGETYVWKEGMSGWLPGAEVPELAQLFEPEAAGARSKPPPPPPAALKPKAAKKPAEGMPTFDTSHFKVREGIEEAPDESALSLEMNLPFHKPGVSGRPEAPKAKPEAPKAKPEANPKQGNEGDWSDRTHVEMLPFGERVHQEKVASELFDAPAEITNSSKALDLSKFASKDAKAPARPAPQPVRAPAPLPPPARSKLPVIAVLVLAAAAIIAGLIYFLD
ncbi:MAG TPA: DUF4339 domain-containing protein [Myxococcales bacterium]|nr:DUF4339 domain-containing protein [Myxococcales bacterium]